MDMLPRHLFAPPSGIALGRVTDTNDPQSRGRVKVMLVAIEVEIWAACVVPSAGANYGVAMLPKLDEIVVVAMLTPDQGFVLGAVWSGRSTLPTEASPVEDRYAIRTKDGASVVLDNAVPAITMTTPTGNTIVLTTAAGGSCTVTIGGSSIEVTPDGATITTGASIELQTATVTVNAASVAVNAAMSQFSGVVQCDTLIANAVVSTSYTPGAGNIW